VGGCGHARDMSAQAINVKLLIRLVDIRFESLLEHRLHVIRFMCLPQSLHAHTYTLSPNIPTHYLQTYLHTISKHTYTLSPNIPTHYLQTAHDHVSPSPLKLSNQLSFSSTVYKMSYYILYSYTINTLILLKHSYMRKCALFIP